MHRLSEIDSIERRAICSECGPVPIVSKGWQSGRLRFKCGVKAERKREAARLGRRPEEWSALKALTCERCGFVPEDPVQLELHNHGDERCRQTLCANCHRLITHGRPGGGSKP